MESLWAQRFARGMNEISFRRFTVEFRMGMPAMAVAMGRAGIQSGDLATGWVLSAFHDHDNGGSDALVIARKDGTGNGPAGGTLLDHLCA
jgi:hypothetical protein